MGTSVRTTWRGRVLGAVVVAVLVVTGSAAPQMTLQKVEPIYSYTVGTDGVDPSSLGTRHRVLLVPDSRETDSREVNGFPPPLPQGASGGNIQLNPTSTESLEVHGQGHRNNLENEAYSLAVALGNSVPRAGPRGSSGSGGTSRSSQFLVFGDDDDSRGVQDSLEDDDDDDDKFQFMSLGRRYHPDGVAPTAQKDLFIPPTANLLTQSGPAATPNFNNPFFLKLDDSTEDDQSNEDFSGVGFRYPVPGSAVGIVQGETSSEERIELDEGMLSDRYNFVDGQGSIVWGYELEDQHQHQEVRQDGSMKGHFGWTAPNGHQVSIEYIADQGGYRVISSHGIHTKNSDAVHHLTNKHNQAHQEAASRRPVVDHNHGLMMQGGVPLPTAGQPVSPTHLSGQGSSNFGSGSGQGLGGGVGVPLPPVGPGNQNFNMEGGSGGGVPLPFPADPGAAMPGPGFFGDDGMDSPTFGSDRTAGTGVPLPGSIGPDTSVGADFGPGTSGGGFEDPTMFGGGGVPLPPPDLDAGGSGFSPSSPGAGGVPLPGSIDFGAPSSFEAGMGSTRFSGENAGVPLPSPVGPGFSQGGGTGVGLPNGAGSPGFVPEHCVLASKTHPSLLPPECSQFFPDAQGGVSLSEAVAGMDSEGSNIMGAKGPTATGFPGSSGGVPLLTSGDSFNTGRPGFDISGGGSDFDISSGGGSGFDTTTVGVGPGFDISGGGSSFDISSGGGPGFDTITIGGGPGIDVSGGGSGFDTTTGGGGVELPSLGSDSDPNFSISSGGQGFGRGQGDGVGLPGFGSGVDISSGGSDFDISSGGGLGIDISGGGGSSFDISGGGSDFDISGGGSGFDTTTIVGEPNFDINGGGGSDFDINGGGGSGFDTTTSGGGIELPSLGSGSDPNFSISSGGQGFGRGQGDGVGLPGFGSGVDISGGGSDFDISSGGGLGIDISGGGSGFDISSGGGSSFDISGGGSGFDISSGGGSSFDISGGGSGFDTTAVGGGPGFDTTMISGGPGFDTTTVGVGPGFDINGGGSGFDISSGGGPGFVISRGGGPGFDSSSSGGSGQGFDFNAGGGGVPLPSLDQSSGSAGFGGSDFGTPTDDPFGTSSTGPPTFSDQGFGSIGAGVGLPDLGGVGTGSSGGFTTTETMGSSTGVGLSGFPTGPDGSTMFEGEVNLHNPGFPGGAGPDFDAGSSFGVGIDQGFSGSVGTGGGVGLPSFGSDSDPNFSISSGGQGFGRGQGDGVGLPGFGSGVEVPLQGPPHLSSGGGISLSNEVGGGSQINNNNGGPPFFESGPPESVPQTTGGPPTHTPDSPPSPLPALTDLSTPPAPAPVQDSSNLLGHQEAEVLSSGVSLPGDTAPGRLMERTQSPQDVAQVYHDIYGIKMKLANREARNPGEPHPTGLSVPTL